MKVPDLGGRLTGSARSALARDAAVLAVLWATLAPARGDVVFPNGSNWRFLVAKQEASTPVSAWRAPAFNDSGWTNGAAPVGYGETDIVTAIPSSLAGNYSSVFFRRTFVVANPAEVTQLALTVRIDDGYVAWINGTEVGRYNVATGNLAYSAFATTAGEPVETTITLSTNLSSLLVAGTNVVAIHAFNANMTSSDLLLDARLAATVDTAAPVQLGAVPVASTTVSALTWIEVFFDENVTGVDAADLLVNGVATATNLVAYSPQDYLFRTPQPPTGTVTVAWAPGHGITDVSAARHPFAGGSWSYLLDPRAIARTAIVSEFMADNANGLQDEDGDRSDWIEIYNTGPAAVNLEGWFLTDAVDRPTKWRFPAVSLDVNSYLCVWASNKNRTNPAAALHTNFKLDADGEYLGLLDPFTNVVSEFRPQFPAQTADVSYGRDRVNPNLLGFFPTPTPGAANSTSGPGFAPAPAFSLESGLYTNATLSVALSSPSGTIRYTTDGSMPSSNSAAYATPLGIVRGTVVKARVYQDGLLPGPVAVRCYHLLDASTRDFSSNLPVLIIDTGGSGVAENVAPGQLRTPCSLCVVDTVRGRSSLRAKPQYLGTAEVEIFGQTSAGFPKKPYNIEIQDEYRQDRAVPLLGMPADADWKLRNPYSDKCLMNDFLGYELHEQMGHYDTRTRCTGPFFRDQQHGCSWGDRPPRW